MKAPMLHILIQEARRWVKRKVWKTRLKCLAVFFDGIEYRGYEQSVVEKLAECSGVPVWNGLTDVDHPTQILADMLTIEEHISKAS